MKRVFFWLPLALVLMGAATMKGYMIIFDKPATLETCNADSEGAHVRQGGGANQGPTRDCFCRSDGAATPAYQWCSLKIAQGEAVVCTGGSTTVCP